VPAFGPVWPRERRGARSALGDWERPPERTGSRLASAPAAPFPISRTIDAPQGQRGKGTPVDDDDAREPDADAVAAEVAKAPPLPAAAIELLRRLRFPRPAD
jgi:hypothetical protein